MNKTATKIFIAVLTVLLLAGVTVYAVSNYGSKDDPLITKSYLDSVVQSQVETELETQLKAAENDMRSSTAGEFTELTLSSGQTLRCGIGGELLLCSGSARASGALADTTEGSSVGDGSALPVNHLYMAAEDGSGLSAAGSCKVLVSGSYSID